MLEKERIHVNMLIVSGFQVCIDALLLGKSCPKNYFINPKKNIMIISGLIGTSGRISTCRHQIIYTLEVVEECYEFTTKFKQKILNNFFFILKLI